MFKCSNMIKYVKYLKYMISQVPVHPYGFSTVPVDEVFLVTSISWVSSAALWWFNVYGEETPLHIRTATGLAVT